MTERPVFTVLYLYQFTSVSEFGHLLVFRPDYHM
jgi:hypothetical protein